MLTGSNTLSLPSPLQFSRNFSRSAFFTILESGTGQKALKFTPQARYPNALICIARQSFGSLGQLFSLHLASPVWRCFQVPFTVLYQGLFLGPSYPHVTCLSSLHPLPPPPPSLSVGSFSNDDGDGKENVKTAIGLLSKTTSEHVHHAFLYISLNCRYCATTT